MLLGLFSGSMSSIFGHAALEEQLAVSIGDVDMFLDQGRRNARSKVAAERTSSGEGVGDALILGDLVGEQVLAAVFRVYEDQDLFLTQPSRVLFRFVLRKSDFHESLPQAPFRTFSREGDENGPRRDEGTLSRDREPRRTRQPSPASGRGAIPIPGLQGSESVGVLCEPFVPISG